MRWIANTCSITPRTLLRAAQAQPEGALVQPSLMDGTLRYVSYRRLSRYPVFVATSLSIRESLKDWWRNTLLHAAILAFLVMVLGFLGWRMVRQDRAFERTLERLAMIDELTGLANRRQFGRALVNEVARGRRQGRPLALVLLDVDFFKQYNDAYGHPADDQCLRAIARTVGDAVKRPGDLAARYGGEEIAVLLPDTDASGGREVAERIRLAVHDLSIPHAGSPLGTLTLSAGVSALRPEEYAAGNPAEALVMAADEALYAAKKRGRNQVSSPSGHEASLE
jgi:diguanylate cyclase (GGDEF)-like protein